MAKFVFDRVENMAGKGENVVYWHFLLLPLFLKKAAFSGRLKAEFMW